MADIVSDYVASYLASLTDTPTFPAVSDSDFGADLWAYDSVDYGREVSAAETLGVEQACYRRLITPRGKLAGDPDYGYAVTHILHQPLTPLNLQRHSQAIRDELRKDERVTDVTVTIQLQSLTSLRIEIQCSTVLGPFRLTLAVTSAATVLAREAE